MDKVNSLKENTEQSVSGWTFNLGSGPWNKDPSYLPGTCSGSLWFGYESGNAVGSIKTTFYGSSNASLTFGNCCPTGTVNLYLDGIIIASAEATSMKTVTFDYSYGNELKLDEINKGIIRFEDFKISNCEGKQLLSSKMDI